MDKLAIIGTGMIGGSLALALKDASACGRICGFGRNVASLEEAVRLGVIDEYHTDMQDAIEGAEMVVVATPLASYPSLFAEMQPYLGHKTVITDVGSAKACTVAAARNGLGDHVERFVPGHPIAGRERTGVGAATGDLFRDHIVILTPIAETDSTATGKVREMWTLTGATVTELDMAHHDEVLAATSHLPHMLAYALVDCLASKQDKAEIFAYAAGGFTDFTRIASSDPQMWHDICLANRDALLGAVDDFGRHLQEIHDAINRNDSDALLKIFSKAKTARDRLMQDRQK